MLHAIAAHQGHGCILIKVLTPAPENFRYYEVRIATDVGGPYSLYNNYQFFHDYGILRDVPLEITIYMQIRSVVSSGNDTVGSDWVQVRRAVLSKPRVIMQCRSIRDSRISETAAFPVPFRGDDVLAFKPLTELIIR